MTGVQTCALPISQFVHGLGKGAQSRSQVAVFDESEAVQVEQRAAPGSQDIQLYDAVLLAHHFDSSRSDTLYRLKNMKLIDDSEFQRLKAEEDKGAGNTIASFLAVRDADRGQSSRDDFRRRFMGLALEAYRRDDITKAKLTELAAMVELSRRDVQNVLASMQLD